MCVKRKEIGGDSIDVFVCICLIMATLRVNPL